MSTTLQTFPYTAERKGYLITVATFGLSIVIEMALWTLFIVAVVHNDVWRLLLLLAHTCLSIVVIRMLLHPLWTKHRLTGTHLEIRYGSFRLDVPRDAISSLQTVREPVPPFQAMKAQVDTKKHRLLAAFSDEGQVLLTLERPLSIKMDRNVISINSILINVNERGVLLGALSEKRPVAVIGTK